MMTGNLDRLAIVHKISTYLFLGRPCGFRVPVDGETNHGKDENRWIPSMVSIPQSFSVEMIFQGWDSIGMGSDEERTSIEISRISW